MRIAVVVALLVAIGATVLLTVDEAGDGVETVDGVASFWNGTPMSCRVTDFEQGRRRLELFRCRSDGGPLPPGRYDQRTTTWYSDLDGRRAATHDILITPDGIARGWAAY